MTIYRGRWTDGSGRQGLTFAVALSTTDRDALVRELVPTDSPVRLTWDGVAAGDDPYLALLPDRRSLWVVKDESMPPTEVTA